MASDLAIIIDEMKQRLEQYEQILKRFGSFERAMSAENVVHCAECAHFDSENLTCKDPVSGGLRVAYDFTYCSSGMTQETYDILCEAVDNGAFNRVHIISAAEAKALLSRSTKEGDETKNEGVFNKDHVVARDEFVAAMDKRLDKLEKEK